MTLLLVAATLLVLLALAILGYVAYPQRGRSVPYAPGLSEGVRRVVSQVDRDGVDPAYGVWSSPDRDERARERFERAEERVLRLLGRARTMR